MSTTLNQRIEQTIGSIQYVNLGCQAIATVGEIPPEVQQLRDVLDQCLEDQRTLKALLEQRKD